MVAVAVGERPGEAAGVDPALDPPAHIEEAPARASVHVLLCQAGQGGEDLQRAFNLLENFCLRQQIPCAVEKATVQVEQQSPEVAGQSFAHARGRAARPGGPGR